MTTEAGSGQVLRGATRRPGVSRDLRRRRPGSRFAHHRERNQFIVSGKVESDYPAHSIVVANESSATRSDYWRKCFAGRVAEDNTFRMELDELDRGDGRLVIVCCFNNGAVVGKDGLGLRSGLAKRYRFKDDEFTFDEGWSPVTPMRARPSRSCMRKPVPSSCRPTGRQHTSVTCS